MADIIINGPEGRVEARYVHNKKEGTPIALILAPHPKDGGNMNDQTTYALYKSFVESGFNVLRFNYRGIEGSEGSFVDDEQALADAAYVLDWLQAHNPTASECWVGGFDYGSWITMQLLMRRPEIDNFIAIAPPADDSDFTFLAPCPADGMMLRGSDDKVVSRLSVARLAKKINDQGSVKVDYYEIDKAPHNFDGKFKSMMLAIKSYIEKAKPEQNKNLAQEISGAEQSIANSEQKDSKIKSDNIASGENKKAV